MASQWPLVAVEEGFATFARTATQPLTHVTACGDELLPRRVCDDVDGTRAELERLRTLHDSPLWRILAADLAARCGQPLLALPTAREAWAYAKAWQRAAARVALAKSQPQEALRLLQPLIDAGDLVALSILRPAFNALPLDELRAHLATAVAALDDAAPPELRADLALACSVVGDAECVRFHGLRAAARGVATARAPLEWLAAHHPAERVRADARAWLATLPNAAAPP
jgi:hypothetical protein